MEAQVVAEVERRLVDLQSECNQRVQEAQEQQFSAEKRCQFALESAKQAQFMADRVQVKCSTTNLMYQLALMLCSAGTTL